MWYYLWKRPLFDSLSLFLAAALNGRLSASSLQFHWQTSLEHFKSNLRQSPSRPLAPCFVLALLPAHVNCHD